MANKTNLKLAVRMFYDLQRVRIQVGGRILAKDNPQGIDLDDTDIEFFNNQANYLLGHEKEMLKYITSLLEDELVYTNFLKGVKGCGPTMSAVMITEFDIEKAEKVSQMWSFAGLHVVDGKAPKPVKGEKLKYNKWLRSKLVGVLGTSFLRSNSPYREFYDNYKNRLQCKRIPCMACGGKGKVANKQCPNCDGKKIGPWGKSDKHRHNAAIRYMVKMFLIDLYKNWRTLQGLSVRAPYQEEYLGHVHAMRLDLVNQVIKENQRKRMDQ